MNTTNRQRGGTPSRVRIGPVDDVAVLTQLANALYPDVPRTDSDWKRVMRDFGDDLSLAIAWIDGSPKGYSQSILDRSNDVLNVEIAVLEDIDAVEVASALHEDALARQRAASLNRLRASVLGDCMMARYWPGVGFEVVERFHRLSLHLPIDVPRTTTQIHIEELGPSSANLHAAHALYRDGTLDQPGGGEPEDFASWTNCLGDGTRCLIGILNGTVVGYASLRTSEARPTTSFNSLTSVARELRGRGIGRAFKAAVVSWSQDHGFTKLETASASENLRMRAINEALGFTPLPDVLLFEQPRA